MRKLIVLTAGLLIMATPQARGAEQLPRSTPEAQGVSSVLLLELVNSLDDQFDGMHSLMVMRHGNVIAEGWWNPYDGAHNHVLYSLSKSFTSTAVGFAVAEGKVSIDDVVVDLFPEDAPRDATNNLKAMRVRDLLTMTTGHQDEPSTDPQIISAKTFLAQPVPHLPGTHFKYNTAATFMQSAIVQKVTGQSVLEYLRPRLFEPLGIEQPVWDTNFQGICLGGYGLRVRTEDIAKLGQLYLQKGVWQDHQLLPAAWTEMATSKQVSNGSNPRSDWNQGYGFQFWRCRHNAFRGDGAFGQYCVVIPEQDMVVAITSGIGDMQSVLDVLWDKLLPACEKHEMPANSAALDHLRQKLASLEVTPAAGAASSDLAKSVWNKRYEMVANDQSLKSVTLGSTDGGKSVTLTIEREGGMVNVPASYRHWLTGRSALPIGRLASYADEPVAGTLAWSGEDTAEVKVCAYETPFQMTYTLKFSGDTVTLNSQTNVAFGPRQGGPWVGHRQANGSEVGAATPASSTPR